MSLPPLKTIKNHPVVSAVVGAAVFLLWSFPQWFGSIWPLFTDKTLPEWIADKRWTVSASTSAWLTLVIGLALAVLFAVTLYEVRRRPPLSEVGIAAIEKAGTLKSYAGQADWLAARLEEIWHQFNNENKKLLYPLGKRVIPDEIKEWTDKELWSFRLLYRSHIGALKKIDPEFHSSLVDEDFPCDGQDYLTVKRKIEDHARLLRERGNLLVQQGTGRKSSG